MIGKRRRKRAKVADWLRYYDRVNLRLYVNGNVIMGPLSLTDLALMVKYGGYEVAGGEQSLLSIAGDDERLRIDFTAECESTG